jgi:predicted nucleotidyltransferase
MNSQEILVHASSFANHILNKREIIHSILRKYQSYEVVEDEINRSVDTLQNLGEINHYFEARVSKVSVFLPLNLPLYSLVLFAITASYQSDSVVVRPPTRMSGVFLELCEAVSLKRFFPHISLFSGQRDIFLGAHCKTSNAVIFTGKYDNFLKVKEVCGKNVLVLYNGVGHNPLVITETADMNKAVEKAIFVKLFNNGQDCAGPDAILVHTNIIDAFERSLIQMLDRVKIDKDYNDNNTKVGPLFEPEALARFNNIISEVLGSGGRIVYGGVVDYMKNIIQPCVCRQSIKDPISYEEIYGPVFLLIEYGSDDELDTYFNDPQQRYAQKQMYVSVFGHSEYVFKKLPASIVLKDLIVHDVERGVEEYGGYGSGASAISYKGITVSKPILIPREIHTYLFSEYSDFFTSASKEADPEKYIIESLFKKKVVEIFANNLVFAYIFGSFARNRAKSYSDVDTFVCVHRKDPDMVKRYLLWVFEICEVFGKIPDFEYPAEIVEFDELERSVNNFSSLELKSTMNPAKSYDAMVWLHSLSHYKIGILNEEAIPKGWDTIFPDNSSRILRNFLDDLRAKITEGKTLVCHVRFNDVPRDRQDIDNFIKNLGNGRKLIDLLRYIPFTSVQIYSSEVLDIVTRRQAFGKKFVTDDFTRIQSR